MVVRCIISLQVLWKVQVLPCMRCMQLWFCSWFLRSTVLINDFFQICATHNHKFYWSFIPWLILSKQELNSKYYCKNRQGKWVDYNLCVHVWIEMVSLMRCWSYCKSMALSGQKMSRFFPEQWLNLKMFRRLRSLDPHRGDAPWPRMGPRHYVEKTWQGSPTNTLKRQLNVADTPDKDWENVAHDRNGGERQQDKVPRPSRLPGERMQRTRGAEG